MSGICEHNQLQDRQPKFGVRSVNQLRQAFADYVTEYEFTEDNGTGQGRLLKACPIVVLGCFSFLLLDHT